MSWNLDSSRPIYAQIIEKVSLDIVSGKYQPGDKLPSVRDLAAQAGVNPNTMQKALSELERENLVHSARTSGRFITEDKAMIEKMREELASTQIKEFLNKMSQMGFDYEKTITLLEKLGKEITCSNRRKTFYQWKYPWSRIEKNRLLSPRAYLLR